MGKRIISNNNNQNKEKLMKIIMILVILFLIGSFVMMILKEVKSNNSNHIKEISYLTYKKEIVKDEYTIVLIASPTCNHCFKYKPIMNQVLQKYNLKALYLDEGKLKKSEVYELYDNIAALKDKYYENGDPAILTPTTVLFKNGMELESKSGEMSYNGFLNFLVRNGVVKNESL